MNTIFWNVDTQIDFMKPYGKLPVAGGEGAEDIEPQLEYLTQLADEESIQVVNTADYHNQDSEELVFPHQNQKPEPPQTFPPHCMQDTEGVQFVEATRPEDPVELDWQQNYNIQNELHNLDQDLVLYKDKFNVFEGSPHTDQVLDYLDPDKAVVYGVATDVCVKQATFGLTERDIEVYLVEDAVKGIDPEKVEETRQACENHPQVEITNTYEIESMARNSNW